MHARPRGGARLYGGLNFICGKQGILSGEGERGGWGGGVVSGYDILTFLNQGEVWLCTKGPLVCI